MTVCCNARRLPMAESTALASPWRFLTLLTSQYYPEASSLLSLLRGCMFMCVQVHVSVPVYVEARGQPYIVFHFFLETGILTGLEHLKLARHTDQQAPGIYWTVDSQYSDSRTLVCFWGWSLGLYAYKVSTVSTELTPHSQPVR